MSVRKLIIVFQRKDEKQTKNQRSEFHQKRFENKVISKFLKFWVPNDGCFNDASAKEIPRKMLKKQIK